MQTIETDHEWRLRQAREGRAIYLPGKSIEEVKASMAMKANKGPAETVEISLPLDQARVMAEAASETEYLLGCASEVFGLIWSGLASGFLDRNEAGLSAVLDLCSRAMRGAAEKEGEAVGRLARELDQAINRRAAPKPEEA